jgi:hypothetical protein
MAIAGISTNELITSRESPDTKRHLSAAARPFGSLYAIPTTFNRSVKPLESFLPISTLFWRANHKR